MFKNPNFQTYLILSFVLWLNVMQSQQPTRPKLVVGIVVDQMRAEYLYRFQDNYSENGFRRLMKEGFVVKNMHYNYVPTATGSGHASIYTGTTPVNHGIIANNWYDRESGGVVYCAEDNRVFLVDVKETDDSPSSFSRSPVNLQSNTLTDELKLFSNGRSKVIGISLKDRGAVLPAGHLADWAFWYNTVNGNFVTSTYYDKRLPDWLIAFNKRKVADSLLSKEWDFLLPNEKYVNSGPDNAGFEKEFVGKENNVFPFGLNLLRKKNGGFGLIIETPFGNTLLTELAKATILGAEMGKGNEPDFLALSYSSTDYIGHAFGIRSKEVEDTYIRLDRQIAELLEFLDSEIGNKEYLVFLTADHAASDHPIFLNKSRLPGKFFEPIEIKKLLNKGLSKIFGEANYVAYVDKTQVYLNEPYSKNGDILSTSIKILKDFEGIKEVYTPRFDSYRNLDIDDFFRNSHNKDNSGDILLHFKPGWMPIRGFGTSHATAYNDDTHVPMLWYGWKIPKGEYSVTKNTITQIAPTLSLLLDIPFPNASEISPIIELFKPKKPSFLCKK